MSLSVSVLVLALACGVAYAAQCACKCNEQVFQPTSVPDCADCTYNHCTTTYNNTLCTAINATVQAACNPVEPCKNAFEATLCITDRAVGLKCIDMRGILDPWQLDCRCGPIAAACLKENMCEFPAALKDDCVKKCNATMCEPGAAPGAASHQSLTLASALAAALLALFH